MSKQKPSKSDIILNKALELFNAQGLELTGVRELARALDVKPGNVNYYYPTKNDIVLKLIDKLSKEVLQVNANASIDNLYDFLDMQYKVFELYYKYRALIVGFPFVIQSIPDYRQRFIDAEKYRTQKLEHQIQHLTSQGYFAPENLDTRVVVSQIGLLSHHWLSECVLTGVINDESKVCKGFIISILGVFGDACTFKGKLEKERYLSAL